jgi:hypothetical protein
VGLVKLPSKKDLIWKHLWSVEKLKDIYENDFNEINQEVNKRFKTLKLSIVKKKFSNYSIEETEKFCSEQWKILIKRAVDSLLNQIKNRRTKGSEFSDIKIQLEKLEDNIDTAEFELEHYENMYEQDLRKVYGRKIKEKIEIEDYNKIIFWKGIILGVIFSVLVGILLYLFGFA